MCKTVQVVIAVIVGVLALMPNLLGVAGRWVLLLAALVLLAHPWMCKKCDCCDVEVEKPKTKRKK